jgi:hypothetical protein
MNDRARVSMQNFRKTGWLFTPGILFMFLGVAAVVAPRFLIAIGAAFFLLVGAIFCFVAWKLLQFKRKFDNLANTFRGKIYVEGVSVKNVFEQQAQEEQTAETGKKIVYH